MVVDHAGGDEDVATEPLAEGRQGLLDVPRDVPADVDDRVPRRAVQGVVVAAVTVADHTCHAWEQVGRGAAPVEQGRGVTVGQQVLHDGATHERRATEDQDSHPRNIDLRRGQSGRTTNHGLVQRPNVVSLPASKPDRVISTSLPWAGL